MAMAEKTEPKQNDKTAPQSADTRRHISRLRTVHPIQNPIGVALFTTGRAVSGAAHVKSMLEGPTSVEILFQSESTVSSKKINVPHAGICYFVYAGDEMEEG